MKTPFTKTSITSVFLEKFANFFREAILMSTREQFLLFDAVGEKNLNFESIQESAQRCEINVLKTIFTVDP